MVKSMRRGRQDVFRQVYAAILLPYPHCIGIVKQIRFGLICVSSCQVPIRRPSLPPRLDLLGSNQKHKHCFGGWRRHALTFRGASAKKMPCHSNSNFSVKQKKMYSAKRGEHRIDGDRASNTLTARQPLRTIYIRSLYFLTPSNLLFI